ncbi:hypothetical protein VFPFJ_11618 [Purpureocillium lilacinum]|uniref:Uncharacterized protein n=1 Tax=Purpureocillium lilacinum TaxID=33203 RepID=A0A179F0Y2_PURLI|nr:hypothetical protein VFPFJ_11618 [Purpureocillium lilacinum]OAQ59081.1 hypothetical protein VFPFJ_11618 [Purpureocillium lilacinum]
MPSPVVCQLTGRPVVRSVNKVEHERGRSSRRVPGLHYKQANRLAARLSYHLSDRRAANHRLLELEELRGHVRAGVGRNPAFAGEGVSGSW